MNLTIRDWSVGLAGAAGVAYAEDIKIGIIFTIASLVCAYFAYQDGQL